MITRLVVSKNDKSVSKITYHHIADARKEAKILFDQPEVKSVVVATLKGVAKFYQNKARPVEVWITK